MTILKKSAYYSSLVYPLFQFKDITFIILKSQLILFVVVWLLHVVLSFAFEKMKSL